MIIFGAIAVAFFLILVGGFIFGHDHDTDHDHSFDHGGDHGDHGVSIFSTKVIATFGMGFGAAGCVAANYGLEMLIASAIGLASGLLLAAVMYMLLKVVMSQQSSSLVETDSLVGKSGTVTIAIEKDGEGEVYINGAGGYSSFSARDSELQAIPKGRDIRVVRNVGSMLIVEENK